MSKRGWIILGAILPVVALLGLLAWASVKSGGNPGSFGVNNNFGEVKVSGALAREFSLELLDGSALALSDLRGKVVMVNFWSSWCPPCRREAPILAQVYREYADQPVEFVGVDIWDRRKDALQFIDRYGVTYPNGIDDKGTILIDYGVTGIPETWFIDCKGTTSKKIVGPMDTEKLRAILEELLAVDPACDAESAQ